MINIKNLKEIEDSLSLSLPLSSLVLLFIIISADSMKSLIPCNLRKLAVSNLIYKHVIGFLTLLFFVELVLIENEKENFISVLKKSGILYLLFILTTKMYYPLFMILIFILLIIFMIDIYKKRTNDSKEKIKIIDKIKNILYIFSIILILVGPIIYYSIKKEQYKNNFNIIKFLFGTVNQRCEY